MKISYDYSYLTQNKKVLISHGYAVEDLYGVRIEFICSSEQEGALQLNSDPVTAAMQKNMVMKPIMDTIASKFHCYQYDDTYRSPYDSTEWELYFWSRTMDVQGTYILDLSYFTLSFNKSHTPAQRKCICDNLIALLTEKFNSNPNLKIDIQYTVTVDAEKAERDAKRILPTLIGKPCVYKEMEGKIVENPHGVFFMRKHAKRYGYMLGSAEILEISWAMKSAS